MERCVPEQESARDAWLVELRGVAVDGNDGMAFRTYLGTARPVQLRTWGSRRCAFS
jgi:hypothetical protein